MISLQFHDHWQHNPQPAIAGSLPIRDAMTLTLLWGFLVEVDRRKNADLAR